MGHHALLVPGMRKRDRYFQKVLNIAPANLIGYWPMSELSGSVATDYSGQGNHGAYTGVTLGQAGIGDGRTAASFDGSTSFCNIYSAALAADVNPAEGGLMAWGKVSAPGVWTDSTIRRLVQIQADSSNRILLSKIANNSLLAEYTAGGTAEQITTAQTPSGFFSLLLTWSVASDEVKAYYSGNLLATRTGLGTWAGALSNTSCLIGATSTGPASVWSGALAHVALWAGAGVPAVLQAAAAQLATM